MKKIYAILELCIQIAGFLSPLALARLVCTNKLIRNTYENDVCFSLSMSCIDHVKFLQAVAAMVSTHCNKVLTRALTAERCLHFLCNKKIENVPSPAHSAVYAKNHFALHSICTIIGDSVMTIKDECLNTPLHIAARVDGICTEIILSCLSSNASLMVMNNLGNLPLHTACFHDNVASIRPLLKFHAECAWIYNRKMLGNSVNTISWCASVDALKEIVSSAGVEIMLSRCTRGCTILIACVERGDVQMLQFVLSRLHTYPVFEAFFCALSDSGQTCVHLAILYQNEWCLSELLKYAPREAFDVKNCSGHTCVQLANRLKLPKVVRALNIATELSEHVTEINQ